MMATPQTRAGKERLPALDGLRSVAVLLVIAFHCGLANVRGGFIGVDIFFVLSGFVIVRALLAERERSGTIRLGDFWRRRIARLVPAAAVCVVVSSALFAMTSSPTERAEVVGDARASLLSVSNWWFLRQSTDYFREAIESSPFLHMWSLSAEEQFYVVLPLLFLSGCLWLRRDQLWVTATVTIAAAATAWSLAGQVRFSELRVYFGSDTRVYQVLWGAMAAVLLSLVPKVGRVMEHRTVSTTVVAAGWVGVAVLSWVDVLDPNRRGMLAAAAALALICPLATSQQRWSASILSATPVRALGEISYGVYLWHWPVIIVLRRLFVMGNGRLFIVATMITIVVAYAMRHWLEVPIITWARRDRKRDRTRARQALPFVLLAGPIVASVVVVPLVLSPRIAPTAAVQRPGFSIGTEAAAPTPRTARRRNRLSMAHCSTAFVQTSWSSPSMRTTRGDFRCDLVTAPAAQRTSPTTPSLPRHWALWSGSRLAAPASW